MQRPHANERFTWLNAAGRKQRRSISREFDVDLFFAEIFRRGSVCELYDAYVLRGHW